MFSKLLLPLYLTFFELHYFSCHNNAFVNFFKKNQQVEIKLTSCLFCDSRVLSNKHNITALEWDLPGDKLVMADTAGNVQLWMFKDHILNDWVLIGSAYFPGEHILGAAWFHNGKKVYR